MSRPARALLFLVRVYQSFFSALMPSACKFYPTCSHYAAEALQVHGARRGLWLALKRVARCHPFTRGGVDLVPDSEECLAHGVTRFDSEKQQIPHPRPPEAGGRVRDDNGGAFRETSEVCATRLDATEARS